MLNHFISQRTATGKTYLLLVKEGIALGILSGIVVGLCIALYTRAIDVNYYQKMAIFQKEVLLKNGYDTYTINKTLELTGIGRKFFINEITKIFVDFLKVLSVSLVLGIFFDKKEKKYSSSSIATRFMIL